MARRDYSEAELDMLKTLEGEYLFGNLVNRYNAWAIANGYRERTASGLTYRIRRNLGSVRPLKYQPITAWGRELRVNRKIFSRAIAKDCLPYITYKKRKYVTESAMRCFISTNPSYFKNGDRDRISEIFGETLAKKVDKAPRITNNNACPIIKPSYRQLYCRAKKQKKEQERQQA
jgi:hypothetical protein